MTKQIFALVALIALTTASTEAFARHGRAHRGVAQEGAAAPAPAAEGSASGGEAVRSPESRLEVPTFRVKFSSVNKVEHASGPSYVNPVTLSGTIESVEAVGFPHLEHEINAMNRGSVPGRVVGQLLRASCVQLATAALSGGRKLTIEILSASNSHLSWASPSVSEPNGLATVNLVATKITPSISCSLVRD